MLLLLLRPRRRRCSSRCVTERTDFFLRLCVCPSNCVNGLLLCYLLSSQALPTSPFINNYTGHCTPDPPIVPRTDGRDGAGGAAGAVGGGGGQGEKGSWYVCREEEERGGWLACSSCDCVSVCGEGLVERKVEGSFVRFTLSFDPFLLFINTPNRGEPAAASSRNKRQEGEEGRRWWAQAGGQGAATAGGGGGGREAEPQDGAHDEQGFHWLDGLFVSVSVCLQQTHPHTTHIPPSYTLYTQTHQSLGVSGYGAPLIEHALLVAGLEPLRKLAGTGSTHKHRCRGMRVRERCRVGHRYICGLHTSKIEACTCSLIYPISFCARRRHRTLPSFLPTCNPFFSLSRYTLPFPPSLTKQRPTDTNTAEPSAAAEPELLLSEEEAGRLAAALKGLEGMMTSLDVPGQVGFCAWHCSVSCLCPSSHLS